MSKTTRFPLDFDVLQKGDVIGPDVLEEITQEKAGTDAYKLKVLGLRFQVEQHMEQRGCDVYVVGYHGDSVRILLDAEGDKHTTGVVVSSIRKMARFIQKQIRIDVSEFSEQQLHHHDRMVEVNGKTLQGTIRGRREAFKALPHKRNVPGLPGPEQAGSVTE